VRDPSRWTNPILHEFEGNEAAADAKYDGKSLKISGVVDKVDIELLDDDEYVIQLAAGGQFVLWTVNCDDQSSGVATGIKKGESLTVLGKTSRTAGTSASNWRTSRSSDPRGWWLSEWRPHRFSTDV
jgi:hypothetical protein